MTVAHFSHSPVVTGVRLEISDAQVGLGERRMERR